ncbi:hypothetical protein [Arhodomonas sp. AD133]|uniref:hypothetical protein n=1 Tax=Arhodomonas sp. AD133 TaxID=3415009 RepID=UPI003EB7D624
MTGKHRVRGLVADALLVLVATMLGACSGPAPSMPAPPAVLETTNEYAFSSATRCIDGQTWGEVWDRAVGEFGRQGLRIESYVMSRHESWDELKAYYAERLVSDRGWRADETVVFGAEAFIWSDFAWSFAFRRDGYVIALVGLRSPHGEGGYIPVNVITNIPE